MRCLSIFAVTLAAVLPAAAGPQPAGIVIGWGMDSGGSVTGLTNYFPGDISGCATGVVMIAGRPLTNAIAIAAGGAHSLALTSDGTLVGWGANLEGEAVGAKLSSSGRGSGVVEVRGNPLKGVKGLSAGRSPAQSFSVALRADGGVEAWGTGTQGQTAVPAELTNVVAVSAGFAQTVALMADGTVASWGTGNPPPPGLSNVIAVSAAGEHGRNLALTRDGRVVDWPVRSAYYTSRVPEGISNVVAISAGWSHSLALRTDGTVLGWGANNHGEATGISSPVPDMPGTGTVMVAGQVLSNVVAIAAAHEFSLGLRKDGTVAYWGSAFGPVVPEGLSNVIAVSAGSYFCLAITTNPAVAARWSKAPAKGSP